MRSKIVAVVLVIAAIAVIGVGVGLLAGRSTAPAPAHPVEVVEDSAPQNPPPHVSVPTQPQHSAPVVKPTVVTQSIPVIQLTNIVAEAPTTGSDTNWEEKIDDIVGSDDQDTNKVKQLFAIFPKLPPDGQEEAAQHLSNLVDDEDYKPLGDMLKDDKLSEGVLDELLADVLNRPNTLKLPALLDVSCNSNHIKHEEARDLLELYLGEDYGTDCEAWRTHLNTWLQQNPE